MDFDEINRILDIVRAHDLSEFELEREGFKIRIKKGSLAHAARLVAPCRWCPRPRPTASPRRQCRGRRPLRRFPAPEAPASDETDFAIVKSPIVGTFFRAAEPGAPPFVEVGSIVKKGQVLCIIEAMKLMNEIDSEYDGEVVKIYVENGQPVQYGERLFAMKVP